VAPKAGADCRSIRARRDADSWRLLAERLQAKLNQTCVIENKAGASGDLGTEAVVRAEPDGATIGVSIVGPLALNTLLFSKLSYVPFS
jgi:tripartite-type tricarboxylate transporter receptor subunit TctC